MVDDLTYVSAVQRIPVVGPDPLNTLVTFTTRVGELGYFHPGSGLSRGRAAYTTGLTINGYDPGRPENQGLAHSCTVALLGVQTSDDSTFVAAVDDVGRPDPQSDRLVEIKGWHVDD